MKLRKIGEQNDNYLNYNKLQKNGMKNITCTNIGIIVVTEEKKKKKGGKLKYIRWNYGWKLPKSEEGNR